MIGYKRRQMMHFSSFFYYLFDFPLLSFSISTQVLPACATFIVYQTNTNNNTSFCSFFFLSRSMPLFSFLFSCMIFAFLFFSLCHHPQCRRQLHQNVTSNWRTESLSTNGASKFRLARVPLVLCTWWSGLDFR